MQGLDQINRQNLNAFADAVAKERQNGNFVVLEKQGLHVVGYTAFATDGEAQKHATEYAENEGASAQGRVLAPFGAGQTEGEEA